MTSIVHDPSFQSAKNRIGILQPSYLPWLGFFEQIYCCDTFVLYDDVQFEKGGWRNRNRIKTANGPQWLTVPVCLKGQAMPLIKDVRINPNVGWQRKHINSINQNYRKTPFFALYAESLFKILDQSWDYLLDLNVALINWTIKQLNITTRIVLSSELGIPGTSVQRLIKIVHALGGNFFYEGAAGRNYIDSTLFDNAGISIVFQNYTHPVYSQLYGEFISHLSIIDLLFNKGPDSLEILINKQRNTA